MGKKEEQKGKMGKGGGSIVGGAETKGRNSKRGPGTQHQQAGREGSNSKETTWEASIQVDNS